MLEAIEDPVDESGPNLRARLVAVYAAPAVLDVGSGLWALAASRGNPPARVT